MAAINLFDILSWDKKNTKIKLPMLKCHKHMASMIYADFESKDLTYISYPEDHHITHTKSNGLRVTVSIDIYLELTYSNLIAFNF